MASPYYGASQAQLDKTYRSTFARTPSPTPSEQAVLDDDGKPHLEKYFKKENWKTLLVVGVLIAIAIIFSLLHDKIVHALEPEAQWMYKTKGGFLIPIALLVIMSIPPLFGHELVIVLVGFTWGLGYGFAIASAGTILGELLTFYLAKTLLSKRSAKLEHDKIQYALLARVIRDGGLKVAIIARYSVIPGHLLTALFSTCGISVITFLISAVASLPKQFSGVYLGYALKLSADGQVSRTSQLVKYGVLAVTIVLTIYSMRFMRAQQHAIRNDVVYERRKARQTAGGAPAGYVAGTVGSTYASVPLDEDREDAPLSTYAAPMGTSAPPFAQPRPQYPPAPLLAAGPVSNVRATSPAVLPEADAFPRFSPPQGAPPAHAFAAPPGPPPSNPFAAPTGAPPAYPPPGHHFIEPSDDDDYR